MGNLCSIKDNRATIFDLMSKMDPPFHCPNCLYIWETQISFDAHVLDCLSNAGDMKELAEKNKLIKWNYYDFIPEGRCGYKNDDNSYCLRKSCQLHISQSEPIMPKMISAEI